MAFPWAYCIAADLPSLADTHLFAKQVKDCKDVDLNSWHHPTRKVLVDRGASIERVSLCNGGKYPVFYVRFRYDPMGQTRDYFEPLYAAMGTANGKWPFAFVATSDDLVITLSFDANGAYHEEYEAYKQQ
jgi:hypothetical protein